MRDIITALAVPPGNSLTDEPGKWAWERPPQFSNPDDAIDYITDSVSEGPAKTDMLKLMAAGITVEELVDQITFKGFVEGAITPDVAELIKPAIGIFLYGMGIEEGFEPQMLVDESPPTGQVTDAVFFDTLKVRNTCMYRIIVEGIITQSRMIYEPNSVMVAVKPAVPPSFMDVQEQVDDIQ